MGKLGPWINARRGSGLHRTLSGLRNGVRYVGRSLISVVLYPKYSWPIWFHVVNRRARQDYLKNVQEFSPVQQRVLSELRKEGIASLQLSDLVGEREASDLFECAAETVAHSSNQVRIEKASESAGGGNPYLGKYFLVRLWNNCKLDLNNKLMRFCVSDQIMGIVCSYLEMHCRLLSMDIWYNVPMLGAEVLSQRWHRDGDDKKLVKLFLYLWDVDEEAGPFHYVPGSHECWGRYGYLYRRKMPYGIYPPPGAIEKRFTLDKVRICTGKAGTLILCDTSGFHKGGRAKSKPRLLLNAVYTTEGTTRDAKKLRNYTVGAQDDENISPAARYAIQPFS